MHRSSTSRLSRATAFCGALATAILAILSSACSQPVPSETPEAEPTFPAVIVAVFAHPDDEIVAGPALSRYAYEGHQVHLVTLTSGQVGDARTDIPRGEALGAAREVEARCSAESLGINEPILLGFMDGDIATWDGLPEIRSRLREELRRLQPDVMITWGPDGLSGHTDHRIASSLATEIFQESWGELEPPAKLYYAAIPASPQSQPADSMGDRATVSPDQVTTVVEAADFADRTREAMHCHQTQWNPPEAVDQMFEERQAQLRGRVSFRLAGTRVGFAESVESDLLERVSR